MPDFEFYIRDDRYLVPTLRILTAPDVAGASEKARSILAESLHHLSVEVFADGDLVFAIGSSASDHSSLEGPR